MNREEKFKRLTEIRRKDPDNWSDEEYSEEAMLSDQLEGAPGKLDSEIVPIIKELNKKGFETFRSCAGHDRFDGEIALSIEGGNLTPSEKSEIFSILNRFRLQDIRVVRSNKDMQRYGIVVVTFKSFGKRRGK